MANQGPGQVPPAFSLASMPHQGVGPSGPHTARRGEKATLKKGPGAKDSSLESLPTTEGLPRESISETFVLAELMHEAQTKVLDKVLTKNNALARAAFRLHTKFEYERAGAELEKNEKLHCFLRNFMHGYIIFDRLREIYLGTTDKAVDETTGFRPEYVQIVAHGLLEYHDAVTLIRNFLMPRLTEIRDSQSTAPYLFILYLIKEMIRCDDNGEFVHQPEFEEALKAFFADFKAAYTQDNWPQLVENGMMGYLLAKRNLTHFAKPTHKSLLSAGDEESQFNRVVHDLYRISVDFYRDFSPREHRRLACVQPDKAANTSPAFDRLTTFLTNYLNHIQYELLTIKDDAQRLNRMDYYLRLVEALLKGYGDLGPNYMMACQIYWAITASPVTRIGLDPVERLRELYQAEQTRVLKEHPKAAKKSSSRKAKEAEAKPDKAAQKEHDRQRKEKLQALKDYYEPKIEEARKAWKPHKQDMQAVTDRIAAFGTYLARTPAAKAILKAKIAAYEQACQEALRLPRCLMPADVFTQNKQHALDSAYPPIEAVGQVNREMALINRDFRGFVLHPQSILVSKVSLSNNVTDDMLYELSYGIKPRTPNILAQVQQGLTRNSDSAGVHLERAHTLLAMRALRDSRQNLRDPDSVRRRAETLDGHQSVEGLALILDGLDLGGGEPQDLGTKSVPHSARERRRVRKNK